MPKKIINSLNAGELSPYLYARSDIEKYDSGCLTMENFVPLPYGGATRRPAIEYIGDSSADEGKVRLVPFISSVGDSYVMEFGDEYIRVWQGDSVVYSSETDIVESGTYQWTVSGSGTNEYYLEESGGGDPMLDNINHVFIDSSIVDRKSVSLLSAGSWGFGDSDSLGYDTIYVRLSDGTDPDTKADGYISAKTILTLPSPYAGADLNDIKCAQSVDVMWMVHKDYEIRRISRNTDISFSISAESFDYPCFLEENDTDITLEPSDTTGAITITASSDFFDAGHVGAHLKMKSVRDADNSSYSSSLAANGYLTPSTGINCSLSNWSIETTGTTQWTGKIIVEIKVGDQWEEYVLVADTTASPVGGFKNFSFESDDPEPINTFLRARFFRKAGTVNANFVVDSPDIESIVKITGYTDARTVSATVLSDFQDDPADYSEYAAATNYTKGYKIKGVGGLDLDPLPTENNINAVVGTQSMGMTHDSTNSSYWIVDQTSGTVYELNDSTFAQKSTFSTTSAGYTEDIAWDGTYLYVLRRETYLGIHWTRFITKYDTSGVSQGVSLTAYDAFVPRGLEYFEGDFYMSGNVGGNTRIIKLNASFVQLDYNTWIGDDRAVDFAGRSGVLYALNQAGKKISALNSDLSVKSSFDILDLGASLNRGLAYNGTDFALVGYTTQWSLWEIPFLADQTTFHEFISETNSGTGHTAITDLDVSLATRTPVTKSWSEGAFSDYRGHPRAVSLHENRLCYAGTETNPDTIWMSQLDNYADFSLGDLDTDGLKLTMASGRFNAIQWMVSQEMLIIGTSGSEWALGPSADNRPITPTGFDLKRKTTYGTGSLQGILVNSAVLFMMRQGRKAREWVFSYQPQDNPAQDLSILAEHITDGGIDAWDFQQQPDNIVWGVRSDGTLLGLTYERDQNVVGWHRHNMKGAAAVTGVQSGTFDGDYISLGSEVTLGSDFVVRISGYFDATQGGSYNSIFTTQATSNEDSSVSFERDNTGAGALFHVWPSGALNRTTITMSQSIFDDGWHDIHLEFDNGVMRASVDGVESTPKTALDTDITDVSVNFNIMGKNNVALTDGKLTHFSVSGHFSYDFSEATGTTLTDLSGNSNDGTINIGSSEALFWANTTTTAAKTDLFESIAVIPTESAEDKVWASVRIYDFGKYKRFIGRLNDREWGTNYLTEWQGSDMYVSYTSPGTDPTLTGLEHLEGRTVKVVADGVILTDEVVANGQIDITGTYTTVVVGLPFTSTVAPLYLDAEEAGTQGSRKAVREATIRFKDTFSAKVGRNTTDLESVKFDTYASALYNEDAKTWFDNSSDYLLSCYVVQEDPMPCTVLAMIPIVEVK